MYHRVYRIDSTGKRQRVQDFNTFDDARAFADAQAYDTEVWGVVDDTDEWNDLHPSRPVEL